MNLDIDVVITLDGEQIPAPSGGGCSVVSVTKAELLALIASNDLDVCVQYCVTDYSEFETVCIRAINSNTLSPTGTGLVWFPDYRPTGDYKGQYHSTIGNINGGEIYTWGEFNYVNPEGFPLVPDLPEPNVFDSLDRFTQLPKQEGNNYTLKPVELSLSGLDITWVSLNEFQNSFNADTVYPYGFLSLSMAQLNNVLRDGFGRNTAICINNRVDGGDNNYGISGSLGSGLTFQITNCWIKDHPDEQTGIKVCDLYSAGVIDNVVGAVKIQDAVMVNNTCSINNVTIEDGCFAEIIQPKMSFRCVIENFHVVNGWLAIHDVELHTNITLSNFTFDTNGTVSIVDTYLNANCELSYFTFTDAGRINIVDGQNFKLYNATNVSIDNSLLCFTEANTKEIDLTGFEGVISTSLLHGGRIEMDFDFSVDPILDGATTYQKFIPNGATVTSIIVMGSGMDGVNIQVGIETQSEALISASTASVMSGVGWDGFVTTTENRHISIGAVGGDITTGSIKILVEYLC